MTRSPLVALSLALAALSLLPEVAHADPPTNTVVERSVEVVLLGGGHDTGALVDTVRELLGRLRLVANVHAVASDDDAAKVERGASVARIVVDLRPKDETVLTIDGREGASARRSVRRDVSPSVAREELAHAIQGAIEAQLLADGDRPPPPPPPKDEPKTSPSDGPILIVMPPPPPPHDAVTPAKPTASWGLDVTPQSGAGGFASAAGPVVHLGGEIGFASRRGLAPFGAISVRGLLPFETDESEVFARASVVSLRATGGLEVVHLSWLTVSALAGGGVDVITVAPRSSTLPRNVLADHSTRASPIFTFGARVAFPIVSSVALTLTFLGDVDFDARRYVVLRGTTEEVTLAPWQLRPAVLAGFTFTPFGSGIFAPRGGG